MIFVSLNSIERINILQPFIPFSRPTVSDVEIEELVDSLKSGWITTGPKVSEFEKHILEYTGAEFAAATFSCTAALQLACKALALGPGDEVIMPTYTFTASAQVVANCGATPVFVDVEPSSSFLMDLDEVEAKITPATKAVMPVHYAGNPVDMDRLYAITKPRGIKVIEDAAHAIGSSYKGKMIGSHGSDAICFSFYATKNLSTAEGGMLLSNDADLAKKVKQLSMYGISDSREIWNSRYSKAGSWFYDVEFIGEKANMTDLSAALGIHQLARLDESNATRARYAKIYMDGINVPGVEFLSVRPDSECCWHLFPLLLPEGVDRDDVISQLKERNIGTSVLFRPLHLHTAYRNLLNTKEGDFPRSEALFHRLINLPISPSISDNDVNYIVENVNDLLCPK
ncbi:MAG: DegT/DnrJ/EryC1/StrS family aminotransferase [Rhodospirillales bacterium]|jgi:dTDP-4-amino-4,6-dideoxygalactose transaminase|nr:DegT/DnrJ/EryC1/StrS family aminotransferase [Rhodospirillales bacterium]